MESLGRELQDLPELIENQLFNIIPPHQTHYLSEIAETVRHYNKQTEELAQLARKLYHYDALQEDIPECSERVAELEALEAVTALSLLADDVEDSIDELGSL